MNAQKALAGLAILVTRPERQAEPLCSLIEAEGGEAVRFPTLEIRACNPPGSVFSSLGDLQDFDWLVFISANAVYFALNACDNEFSIPAQVKVAAIGEATALALEQSGIAVDLVPRERFNSEAFLELPEMQSVAGRRFLIVRGRGGREMLADALQERGARVMYAEVYQRLRPTVDIDSYLQVWQERGIDAVTVFSGESLMNFIAMLGAKGMAWARNIPLVVAGERIACQAESHGFKKVILAAKATDWALFDALTRISDPDRDRGIVSGSDDLTMPLSE
ncbi:MAG: uroporphyrinogen-III synthase [Methylococcaceae bacterium]|nr:uroporphyrinogen-III synthase [Methylococcaceae bacterium]MCI0733861.1 uroporphyrinogen-III synthase [Methylococcaceae bacterium]